MKKAYYLQTYLVSDVGMLRKKNEDNFIFHGRYNEKSEDHMECENHICITEPVLYGVFDGMGGEAFGDVASSLMAGTCQKYLLHAGHLKEDAMALCQTGNELVVREEKQRGLSMGSTASMLIFDEKVVVCNVGDSPIYLYRDGVLQSIYEEQTERKLYEELGLQEILKKKKKYCLTQHIGMQGEGLQILPYLEELEVQDQDVFLICSDGLTDMVDEAVIKETLSTIDAESARKLVSHALENGGRDNVTVILIQVKGCN